MNLVTWVKGQWDRAAAVVAGAVGLALLVFGWLGISRVSLETQQLPYLASGAVGSLFALGVAATLWLSADLRDEWRKLDELQQVLEADPPPTPRSSVR